jgi:hypothetical protein
MPALDISNRKRERWITAWFFILGRVSFGKLVITYTGYSETAQPE